MKKQRKRAFVLGTWGIVVMVIAALSQGCATMEAKKPSLASAGHGEAVYQGEYQFKMPVGDWSLMTAAEPKEFEFGFLHFAKGPFPSQTSFVYDDEPYGASRDLEKRAAYYCTRFLFNSGIDLQVTKREKLTINGRPAMALYMGGENPATKEKVRSKVYLVKRGDRIISFVCTQWRPLSGSFSQEPFDQFEIFVKSFKFLKKGFYQNFEEELKKAGL